MLFTLHFVKFSGPRGDAGRDTPGAVVMFSKFPLAFFVQICYTRSTGWEGLFYVHLCIKAVYNTIIAVPRQEKFWRQGVFLYVLPF